MKRLFIQPMKKLQMPVLLVVIACLLAAACQRGSGGGPPTPVPPPPPATNGVDFWLTNSDEPAKLQQQATVLAFGTSSNQFPSIEVDENGAFQKIDGFGYTLTGGSAEVINSLTQSKKQELLQELFGAASNSIGVSYLRISIGASDLNATPFT